MTRLARAVAVLATLLNPELVVIGGAVAAAGDALLEPLRRRLPGLTATPPRVTASGLGDHVVVAGAVRLALDHVASRLLDEPAAPGH